jgi:trigger factor
VGNENLEEISPKFKLTLKQISSINKANLDKTFFDMVLGPGKVKDENEFKTQFRNQLDINYGQMSDQTFYKDVTESIIKNIKFDLPDSFLKRWLIKTPQNKLTESDVSQNYDKYQQEIKEQIILDSILKENDIQIGNDEVMTKMDEQIRKTFYLPEEESIEDNEHLKSYRDNMLKNKDYINYMFDQIRREKLTEIYRKKVKFTEKKIDSEKFMKLNK